jgi:hypothetical protein
MTVCEVATHRIFVALLHSRTLLRRPALRQQWLEALDGLGGFVDLVPGRSPSAPRSGPGAFCCCCCCCCCCCVCVCMCLSRLRAGGLVAGMDMCP